MPCEVDNNNWHASVVDNSCCNRSLTTTSRRAIPSVQLYLARGRRRPVAGGHDHPAPSPPQLRWRRLLHGRRRLFLRRAAQLDVGVSWLLLSPLSPHSVSCLLTESLVSSLIPLSPRWVSCLFAQSLVSRVGFAADMASQLSFNTDTMTPLGSWRTGEAMGLFNLQDDFNATAGLFTVPRTGTRDGAWVGCQLTMRAGRLLLCGGQRPLCCDAARVRA